MFDDIPDILTAKECQQLLKTGCQRRMLPHDYPQHDAVWSFYRQARDNGVWDKIMGNLLCI